MTQLPHLTEDAVRALSTAQSFERGQSYYREGAIINPVRQGMRLKAACAGSDPTPYRVTAILSAQGVAEASCTCPYDWGGYCKHIVALLLTWVHRPNDFLVIEETSAVLERKSKPELIALIQEMLRRQPDLERLLEVPLGVGGKRRTPVDAETYRRQVRHAFRRYEGYGAEIDIAEELEAIKEIGDRFAAQGDWASAQAVYQAVVDEGLEHYGETQDEGDIAGAIDEAVSGLGECLVHQADDPVARRGLQRALFEVIRWDISFGGIDMGSEAVDYLLDHATAEDRVEIRHWVEEALSKTDRTSTWSREAYFSLLLRLDELDGQTDTFLRRAKEAELYPQVAGKLLELGRVDEAIATAREHLQQVHEVLPFAESLEGTGRVAEALALVKELVGESADQRVSPWLAERYEKVGDLPAALDLHLKRFRQWLNVDQWAEVQRVAEKAGTWPELRLRLLAELEREKQYPLLVGIWLKDQDPERAWEAAQKIPEYGRLNYLYRVAQASEDTHPRRAAEVYQALAERAIAIRGRGNYHQAAIHLARARDLYRKLGEAAAWEQYMADLRARHSSLPALKDELRKANL